MQTGYTISPIGPEHNAALAVIIRSALMEFDAAKPGTVYYDTTTDDLAALFSRKGSEYFVLMNNGEVCGGAGYFPTEELPANTCELVKLYLSPKSRGKGLGKMLMQHCEKAAYAAGYRHVYLETMQELTIAVPLYEKLGYRYLQSPLGRSGHCGCEIWMLKDLDAIKDGYNLML
ncbi:MAG: GNAT family N-acetyltransferase [Chitinophagaceae bacterium]|nr:MAG: GNAT family N-acetyltransferase [Chitinophagaceae bacterium]